MIVQVKVPVRIQRHRPVETLDRFFGLARVMQSKAESAERLCQARAQRNRFFKLTDRFVETPRREIIGAQRPKRIRLAVIQSHRMQRRFTSSL